jgi:hypothetical protein
MHRSQQTSRATTVSRPRTVRGERGTETPVGVTRLVGAGVRGGMPAADRISAGAVERREPTRSAVSGRVEPARVGGTAARR